MELWEYKVENQKGLRTKLDITRCQMEKEGKKSQKRDTGSPSFHTRRSTLRHTKCCENVRPGQSAVSDLRRHRHCPRNQLQLGSRGAERAAAGQTVLAGVTDAQTATKKRKKRSRSMHRKRFSRLHAGRKQQVVYFRCLCHIQAKWS